MCACQVRVQWLRAGSCQKGPQGGESGRKGRQVWFVQACVLRINGSGSALTALSFVVGGMRACHVCPYRDAAGGLRRLCFVVTVGCLHPILFSASSRRWIRCA